MKARISWCQGVAGVQLALAAGSLVLGYPAVAAAFGVFAVAQIASIAVERCGIVGPGVDRLCAPDTPGRPHRRTPAGAASRR
jgi:hypothetical protein